ncbi:cell cycle progression protein 1 isoform X1 [Lepisosteus oculatus]|uniref:cell cycle progression protein 1 isoform X1 n=1 Tax=Lepisosteus oculatus TaxID=7918 RepID=UPI003710EA4C
MSENSSDTESSCGWTIISNEGSDIETLGPENGGGDSLDVPENLPALEEELQDVPSVQRAKSSEERAETSLEDTLKEDTLQETLAVSEVGQEQATEEQVTFGSSSDHSDIVTLEPSRAAELGVWEDRGSEEQETGASEELYLGTSSSSQYSFRAPETPGSLTSSWKLPESLRDLRSRLTGCLSGSHSLPVFPAEPRVDDSSSDESHERPSPVLRKRRVRRSTAPASGAEEGPAGGAGEQEQEPQAAAAAAATVVTPQGHVSGTLNKCILLALVIAISMGFGHFYGTVQIQERQKLVERLHENELNDVRDDLYLCQKEQDAIVESKEVVKHLREDLEEKQDMVLSLTGIMDTISKENQQLRMKQAELQSQKEDLALRLKQTAEERHTIESRQKSLVNENQHLKNSLEREEESLSTLQEELRNLRAQVRSLEEVGAGTDSIITENQRLKDHLEEEKQRIHSFLRQKETLMAEAQMLRRELDRERKVTDELKEELERMSRTLKDEGEADPETEELQARLTELEKKLNFEQQRSDLWERLYVETREENSKGDKPKKPKEGIFTKVKETFDAVKNSTKEFVHHHKEQIKKAKEAVKENLKKFSDSVKSTFRHFKDSATRAFDKTHKSYEKRYQERKDVKPVKHEYHEPPRHRRDQDDGQASWQHQHQRPFHRHPRKSTTDTYQAKQNMRKTGAKTCNKEERESHRIPKGCSGVFDCAYQESMSLFNKALDPIRADEFTQLIRSYLKKEVDHFHHWRELESFINSFFHNGVFIHDQMLFTDFVSGVEEYLEDMDEYQQHSDDVFEDLDEYVYRHFFGDTYSKQYGPSRPFEGPVSRNTDDRHRRQERKHQRAHSRHHRERKWSKPGRASGRHMANVKIELGPMPFDPKY